MVTLGSVFAVCYQGPKCLETRYPFVIQTDDGPICCNSPTEETGNCVKPFTPDCSTYVDVAQKHFTVGITPDEFGWKIDVFLDDLFAFNDQKKYKVLSERVDEIDIMDRMNMSALADYAYYAFSKELPRIVHNDSFNKVAIQNLYIYVLNIKAGIPVEAREQINEVLNDVYDKKVALFPDLTRLNIKDYMPVNETENVTTTVINSTYQCYLPEGCNTNAHLRDSHNHCYGGYWKDANDDICINLKTFV